jgi:hypothetical protein
LRVTILALRKVIITLTNKILGQYEARSYPHDNMTDDNLIELYNVPIFEIVISGTDDSKQKKEFLHKAPRFFPYWNDPKVFPDPHYKTKGWVNSGLSAARTVIVPRYIKDYQVQNRYSPGLGAIVMKGTFYIHGGPADEKDFGFGSAGCVEIIGDLNVFKADIAVLSGYGDGKFDFRKSVVHSDLAIEALVNKQLLIVDIRQATVPDIKKNFSRQVPTTDIREFRPRLSRRP